MFQAVLKIKGHRLGGLIFFWATMAAALARAAAYDVTIPSCTPSTRALVFNLNVADANFFINSQKVVVHNGSFSQPPELKDLLTARAASGWFGQFDQRDMEQKWFDATARQLREGNWPLASLTEVLMHLIEVESVGGNLAKVPLFDLAVGKIRFSEIVDPYSVFIQHHLTVIELSDDDLTTYRELHLLHRWTNERLRKHLMLRILLVEAFHLGALSNDRKQDLLKRYPELRDRYPSSGKGYSTAADMKFDLPSEYWNWLHSSSAKQDPIPPTVIAAFATDGGSLLDEVDWKHPLAVIGDSERVAWYLGKEALTRGEEPHSYVARLGLTLPPTHSELLYPPVFLKMLVGLGSNTTPSRLHPSIRKRVEELEGMLLRNALDFSSSPENSIANQAIEYFGPYPDPDALGEQYFLPIDARSHDFVFDPDAHRAWWLDGAKLARERAKAFGRLLEIQQGTAVSTEETRIYEEWRRNRNLERALVELRASMIREGVQLHSSSELEEDQSRYAKVLRGELPARQVALRTTHGRFSAPDDEFLIELESGLYGPSEAKLFERIVNAFNRHKVNVYVADHYGVQLENPGAYELAQLYVGPGDAVRITLQGQQDRKARRGMRILQRLLEPKTVALYGTQGFETRQILEGAPISRRWDLIAHSRDHSRKDDSGEFHWSPEDYEQAVDDVYGHDPNSEMF